MSLWTNMVLRGDIVGNVWPPNVEKFSLFLLQTCLWEQRQCVLWVDIAKR